MPEYVRLWSLSLAALVAGCSSADAPNTDTVADDGEPTAVSVQEIIGGTPAAAYPEAAVVDIDRGATGTWYACSATLIAPRVVLTAGHCIDGHTKWGIYVHGEYRLSTSGITYDWAEGGAALVNPNHHDLGLLFFDQAIALATYPTIATSALANGSKVLNIGRILDGAFTSSSYQAPAVVSSAAIIGYPFDYMSSSVIQPGDSGGAVMADGTHKLVAVNSGSGGGVQVLARVDLLATWITGQIASHAPPSNGGATDAGAPPPARDAGAPPADAGAAECAREREPNDAPSAATPMSKSLCGALSSATDVDWLTLMAPAGTTTLQLTSSSDAVFALGRFSHGQCRIIASAQKTSKVTSVGGATPLCVAISSPGRKTGTYSFTAKN
jgi:V8-like Glu-specific endopeptidase